MPLSDPARRAGDGEQDGEHLDWEAHRLVDDARVEVDVRVELPLDEVLVLEGDALEFQRDVEERVAAGDFEDLVGEVLNDGCPGVEVLVDAMAEAHEPSFAFLHALDEGGDAPYGADLLEHAQHGLVGAAVERAVERGARASDGGVGVGVGAADGAHGVRAAVLLVVGVEDEEDVQRPLEYRVGFVDGLRHLVEHVEQVAAEAQFVVGVDEWLAEAVAVGEGGERWHLSDEARGLELPVLFVEDVIRLRVEGGEGSDRADEHAHRVGIVAEAIDDLLDVFVDEGAECDLVSPQFHLVSGGQLAVDDEVGGLQVR